MGRGREWEGNQRQEGPLVSSAEAIRHPRGAFAALTSRSYRIYLGGQSLANTGTWMQSIAQDWLVYDLTHSSTSVGVTMALQFLPILVLGLHTGGLADRVPKRRILLTTQTLNAAATTALAVITISGAVHTTDVYAFALLSGLIFAFDAPARQAFVAEVVPPGQLRAAIALNAAVFQATRLIGPALRREPGALRTTARYLRQRPDVLWTIFLVGMFGTFGLNFPIVLTAMAKSTFHGNASTYGLFNIALP